MNFKNLTLLRDLVLLQKAPIPEPAPGLIWTPPDSEPADRALVVNPGTTELAEGNRVVFNPHRVIDAQLGHPDVFLVHEDDIFAVEE